MAFYGCKKDDRDDRDRKFSLQPPDDYVVPDEHDLTAMFPPAVWQGNYGICVTHGATWAWRYNRLNNDLPDIPLSRAMLYWESGVVEGDTSDVGRQIRDVVRVMAKTGVAKESLWDYDKIGQQPPPEVYADAANQTVLEYQRVETTRQALNTAIYVGHPVIVGVPLFAAFESDEVEETGIVPMPTALQTPVGQHCLLLGAYDTAYDTLLNSWGLGWGMKGFCKLPRGYLERFASDCWTLFIDSGSSS